MIFLRLLLWGIGHWIAWVAAFGLMYALLYVGILPSSSNETVLRDLILIGISGTAFSFVQDEIGRRREDRLNANRPNKGR